MILEPNKTTTELKLVQRELGIASANAKDRILTGGLTAAGVVAAV